jgi:ATP-binding cassette subfamily B (MDR/TAP) protein 1
MTQEHYAPLSGEVGNLIVVRSLSALPNEYTTGANYVLVGQLTAIVGLSGSGKSTVASLISRFYDPQSGDVLLDGRNVKDINIKSLRGFISLVQQEPSLLDRSILENIALGLVNSPPHAHLEKTLLSGILAKVAGDVRGGQDLTKAAETAGSEVRGHVTFI